MRRFQITIDGKSYDVSVEEVGDGSSTASNPAPAASLPETSGGSARIAPPPTALASSAPSVVVGANDVPSPLSGTIVEVHVAEGQEVQQGEKLITLEAMKMNTAVSAPRGGKVESIKAEVGSSVQEGQILLTLS